MGKPDGYSGAEPSLGNDLQRFEKVPLQGKDERRIESDRLHAKLAEKRERESLGASHGWKTKPLRRVEQLRCKKLDSRRTGRM